MKGLLEEKEARLSVADALNLLEQIPVEPCKLALLRTLSGASRADLPPSRPSDPVAAVATLVAHYLRVMEAIGPVEPHPQIRDAVPPLFMMQMHEASFPVACVNYLTRVFPRSRDEGMLMPDLQAALALGLMSEPLGDSFAASLQRRLGRQLTRFNLDARGLAAESLVVQEVRRKGLSPEVSHVATCMAKMLQDVATLELAADCVWRIGPVGSEIEVAFFAACTSHWKGALPVMPPRLHLDPLLRCAEAALGAYFQHVKKPTAVRLRWHYGAGVVILHYSWKGISVVRGFLSWHLCHLACFREKDSRVMLCACCEHFAALQQCGQVISRGD